MTHSQADLGLETVAYIHVRTDLLASIEAGGEAPRFVEALYPNAVWREGLAVNIARTAARACRRVAARQRLSDRIGDRTQKVGVPALRFEPPRPTLCFS